VCLPTACAFALLSSMAAAASWSQVSLLPYTVPTTKAELVVLCLRQQSSCAAFTCLVYENG
jgi:hypothetical protein